jgi:methionine-rich copper-binding protein CopC
MRCTLKWIVSALTGIAALSCAPALSTPPHLIAASPADGVSLPVESRTFELTFNRRLSPGASWISVWREDDGATMATETNIDTMYPGHAQVRLLEAKPGTYRLHWHAVDARSTAAADGEQDFTLQNESSAAPRLQVSRAAADSGEKLEIVGKGFAEKCLVKLTLGDDGVNLTSVETNAYGDFDTETRVPPNVAFGIQPLAAEDTQGGAATAALQVRWGGWPPLVGFTVGQPGPRPGEVTFALSARNRSDYLLERVRMVLSDPQGATFLNADPRPQRQNASSVWEIPSMDRGAIGPFHATFRATGAVIGQMRIEFRHRRPPGCSDDECGPPFVSESVSESTEVTPAAAGASPRRQD